jgi:hypothetical protein
VKSGRVRERSIVIFDGVRRRRGLKIREIGNTKRLNRQDSGEEISLCIE